MCTLLFLFFFFFTDTATTEIYTLSLHDALPIFGALVADALDQEVDALLGAHLAEVELQAEHDPRRAVRIVLDRKSTRLNSSHSQISYAVFCLKKKKKQKKDTIQLTQAVMSNEHT